MFENDLGGRVSRKPSTENERWQVVADADTRCENAGLSAAAEAPKLRRAAGKCSVSGENQAKYYNTITVSSNRFQQNNCQKLELGRVYYSWKEKSNNEK